MSGQILSRKNLLAICLGNALEYFDFFSYALFATFIGKAFFPAKDESISLLLSLATFGVGFITRPLGALILGKWGDKRGRKPAMVVSFVAIGIPTLALAVVPTYATIGIAAPLLVLALRLAQGFSLGGEMGPTTAYIVEMAPVMRRGLYGSLQYTTQSVAALSTALLGVLLSKLLPNELSIWGWRIPFLLGAAIVPLGIFLRRSLPDALQYGNFREENRKQSDSPPLSRRQLAIFFVLLVTTTIGTYIVMYMTTYALANLHEPASFAFGVGVITSTCAIIFIPLGGLLSDRIGRKPVIFWGLVGTSILLFPVFLLVSRGASVLLLYGGLAILSMPFAFAISPALIALAESVPPGRRSSVVALTYALAVSVFGGSTQFIVAFLIRYTGEPLSPAYYWMAALLFSIVAASLMTESAPAKLASNLTHDGNLRVAR